MEFVLSGKKINVKWFMNYFGQTERHIYNVCLCVYIIVRQTFFMVVRAFWFWKEKMEIMFRLLGSFYVVSGTLIYRFIYCFFIISCYVIILLWLCSKVYFELGFNLRGWFFNYVFVCTFDFVNTVINLSRNPIGLDSSCGQHST